MPQPETVKKAQAQATSFARWREIRKNLPSYTANEEAFLEAQRIKNRRKRTIWRKPDEADSR